MTHRIVPGAIDPSSVVTREPSSQIAWLSISALILESRRMILIVAVAFGIFGAVIALMWPKKYTTVFSFTPATGATSTGGLSAIAGQFGVSLPGSDVSTSPEFYASLFSTREITQRIVENTYSVGTAADTQRSSFIDLFDIGGAAEGKAINEAIRVLKAEVVSVGVDRQTGVVSVRVKTAWPDVSLQIARLALELVERFNRTSRQTQAEAEKVFLQERVDTARVELRRAESALQGFLDRNRSFQNDPRLLFEHDRLQREVTLRNGVHSVLLQSFEQARVAAVRNTPSISIVETPKIALTSDPQGVPAKAFGGAALGVLVALFLVLLRGALTDAREENPAQFERVSRIWHDAKSDAARAIGRSSSSSRGVNG